MLRVGLTDGFWAEVVATANYLRNRCLIKTLGAKTVFEFWNNRLPNLYHLRIFGMKTYALNKDLNKRKFATGTKLETLVGYSKQSKAYSYTDSGWRKNNNI